jgi:hypothetical protein
MRCGSFPQLAQESLTIDPTPGPPSSQPVPMQLSRSQHALDGEYHLSTAPSHSPQQTSPPRRRQPSYPLLLPSMLRLAAGAGGAAATAPGGGAMGICEHRPAQLSVTQAHHVTPRMRSTHMPA